MRGAGYGVGAATGVGGRAASGALVGLVVELTLSMYGFEVRCGTVWVVMRVEGRQRRSRGLRIAGPIGRPSPNMLLLTEPLRNTCPACPVPACRATTSFKHTAAAQGHSSIFCGTVPAHHHSDLVSLIHNLIEERREKRDTEKPGDRAYQRTPAFAHSVVLDALAALLQRTAADDGGDAAGTAGGGAGVRQVGSAAEVDTWAKDAPRTLPRGGTTDVGHHSGGDATRDTAWPLVREVLLVSSYGGYASYGRPRHARGTS